MAAVSFVLLLLLGIDERGAAVSASLPGIGGVAHLATHYGIGGVAHLATHHGIGGAAHLAAHQGIGEAAHLAAHLGIEGCAAASASSSPMASFGHYAAGSDAGDDLAEALRHGVPDEFDLSPGNAAAVAAAAAAA